jgi:hypothetical protein
MDWVVIACLQLVIYGHANQKTKLEISFAFLGELYVYLP